MTFGCGLGWDQGSIVRWGAHWRHPVNTAEPSTYGSDAALCQLTFTTCCLTGLRSRSYSRLAGSREEEPVVIIGAGFFRRPDAVAVCRPVNSVKALSQSQSLSVSEITHWPYRSVICRDPSLNRARMHPLRRLSSRHTRV